MSRRRRGRQLAVQMLFQGDVGGSTPEEVLAAFHQKETPFADPDGGDDGPGAPPESPEGTDEVDEFAAALVRGTMEHRDEIDAIVVAQAENWRLERMPVVDRNILRLAVYELLYSSDVPHLVVIDEAIELAKQFGSESSGRFINGLLDGILRSHDLPGSDR